MAAENKPDYHLPPQQRWEQADVLADIPPEASDIDEYVRSQGWERILSLGDPNGSLSIDLRVRNRADRTTEYLLEIVTIDMTSPYLVVDNLPEALQRLEGTSEMSAYGLVESVAARALYGVETGHHELRSAAAANRRATAERRRSGSPKPPG